MIVKLALPEVGPIAQRDPLRRRRVCVVAYALASHRRIFALDGTEAAGALAGVLFTAEFIALYESLRFTTAARATVFIYAAPFVVALRGRFLLKDERLRPIQWAGLLFAFSASPAAFSAARRAALTGDALALLAAVLWGATTIVIKATSLRRADPVKVLLYQIGFATLAAPLAAYALWRGGTHASDRDVDRLAHVAGRGSVQRQLHAVVLNFLTRYAGICSYRRSPS